MSSIEIFKEKHPSLESYWRSIILFGRNVASYKFALAKSLLEIIPTDKTVLTLEELAIPYSKYICEHLKYAPKQGTSNSSQFLDTCNKFNEGIVSYDELIATTVKKGFNNVIDAFHVVNEGEIPVEFYKKDYSLGSKKIILTDDIYKLKDAIYFKDFLDEAESRWNLVETAWEIGVSRNLLNINYNDENKILFIGLDRFRRRDVTSARGALNGYQKGKCFYCFDDITINNSYDNLCDVDHFYPHVLQPLLPNINLDGVWNLELTCSNCNRGENGKFAKIPAKKYLERLHRRNEYLINSHHPLRETLMNQTGRTVQERIKFLNNMYNFAIETLIQRWETESAGEEIF